MPALYGDVDGERRIGVNDISFHRRARTPAWPSSSTMFRASSSGSVRCDGLVVSTPVGSTGYNLANGGPVLAWGVEGYVVSFIAPHTLTARALVVAPADMLTVGNTSDRDEVDVSTDGRMVGELGPGEADRRALLRRRGAARPDTGLDLLPPLPGEVRPARDLSAV